MRVFVIGGYGTYGLPTTILLADSDLVSEIALAGRNVDQAERLAAEIGDKASAVRVDGAHEEELASHIAGYDIVVNVATNDAVLPGIRAAIRAGVHYCDVSFGSIADQALQLDAEARAAGITAILSNGAAPCITNLMGVHSARQLDEVEQLQGGRSWMFQGTRMLTSQQWLADPLDSLAAVQEIRPFIVWMLQRRQGTAPPPFVAYEGGQWVNIDAVQNGMEIPLAGGGTVTGYPYRILPPVWGNLPREIGSVSPVELWFSPFPPQLHDLLRGHALRVSEGEVDAETAVNSLFETLESDPGRWLTPPDDFIPLSLDWVTAVGRKEGRAARYSSWLASEVCTERNGLAFTSVPLVIAVLRILRGEVQERGVMHAEATCEPMPFFDEVAPLLPDPPPDGRLIGESFQWLE